MKHLYEQIKFIDTKLIVLYGFKNIIDYKHTLCMNDLDNFNIDLNKLNEIIDEFRKVFNSKNFSLHKTKYKILNKSQSICLLKTCLEITCIPFVINLKKNKKYLCLFSNNNIYNNYINTIKMAENRNFTEDLNIVNSYIEELELKTITKKQLNDGIKKINKFEYYLIPKKLLINNNKIIQINFENYNLNDKILKSFCIEFISKQNNGIDIISKNFIDLLVEELKFEMLIDVNPIKSWDGIFINNKNCIIDDVLIPINCLKYSSKLCHIVNIDNILKIIDNLEIKIIGEYVELYTELEKKLYKRDVLISQKIIIGDEFNYFNIKNNVASMGYSKFQPKNKNINNDENLCKLSDIGNHIIIDNVKGFEITNKNKICDIFKMDNTLNFSYIDYCDKINNSIYYKIINNKKFIHNYEFNFKQNNSEYYLFDTISNLQFFIIPKYIEISNIKIQYNYVSTNGHFETIFINIELPIINNIINVDFNKKLPFYINDTFVNLIFETNEHFEPINDDIYFSIKLWKYNIIT